MTDRTWKETAKKAAFVGLKAWHGAQTAHGPAKHAARIPVVGPLIVVGATLAGGVAGAIDAINNINDA